MHFVKLKGLVNLISLAGIRVLVVTTALLGSTLVVYSGYSLYEQVYTQNRAFSSGSLQYDEGTPLSAVQNSFRLSRLPYFRPCSRYALFLHVLQTTDRERAIR